ncbi:MAG: hypothetical protein AAGG07_13370, partial [Planctomycetota bacterium]
MTHAAISLAAAWAAVQAESSESARPAFEVALAAAERHGFADAPDGPRALLKSLEPVFQQHADDGEVPLVSAALRDPTTLEHGMVALSDLSDRLIAGGRDAQAPIGRVFLDMSVTLVGARNALGKTTPPASAGPVAMMIARGLRERWAFDPDHLEAQRRLIREAPALRAVWLTEARTSFELYDELCRVIASGVELGPSSLPGAVVLGSAGADRHDMSVVGVVIDPGGDDTYVWPEGTDPLSQTRQHIIIDLGGDDTYESHAAFAGPAVAVFGGAVVDDRTGDDVYRTSEMHGLAGGLFGFGLLLDRGGHDRYEAHGPGSAWTIGSGIYGVGSLVDLSGRDLYLGEVLTQGVAGPGGVGLLIDAGGDDLYRADGPAAPSAYGTPGVFFSASQGFSTGVRREAPGGLGAIIDRSGDDRYEAGEFSQGTGYYYALGAILDDGGNDLYRGNRYSQASAAHQAAGVLIDSAGDDIYWAMTAASQSGAWDQSFSLLIDKAGNDRYRGQDLVIGSAAMQSIAGFVDQAGRDQYENRPGRAGLGLSSRDEYHFDRDGVFSFSAFFDLEGDDVYGDGRENGQDVPTGERFSPVEHS